MREGYIYKREFKQSRIHDQLKEAFPSIFTGLSTETENLRTMYIRDLVTRYADMNSTQIIREVVRRLGPLKKNEAKPIKNSAINIYQRQETMPLLPTEEKLVTLINTHPEWDSDQLQRELKKD